MKNVNLNIISMIAGQRYVFVIINSLPYADMQMIKNKSDLIHKKRVFFSEAKDDNLLDSIIQKVKIAQLSSDV